MKNKKTIFGIIVLITIIGFTFTACDEEGEDGETSATFTMTGDPTFMIMPGAGYFYSFDNYSDSEVKITINGSTQTMHPYASLTGKPGSCGFFDIPTSTVTVTYSPANKVRYEGTSWISKFYNK